jgi:hypothetical protein
MIHHTTCVSFLLTYLLTYSLTHSLTHSHTHSLTHSTEQSPWEANRFAASQETARILWNLKLHYCIHKCLYPKPSQSSPYPPHPTSWRSVLILSSHLRLVLPSGLFPTDSPTKTRYISLPSPISATCPARLILLDFITCTILSEGYRTLSFSFWSFLRSPVTSSLWQHIFHKVITFVPTYVEP